MIEWRGPLARTPERASSAAAFLSLTLCAFFLSRGFIKMRFGRRIAFRIIQAIGRSATSLGYSICLAELIISPAMPSATT